MRCAVLDLGSTSFQLLVTDATSEGALTHVLRDRVILNLGAEVASSGLETRVWVEFGRRGTFGSRTAARSSPRGTPRASCRSGSPG